MADIDKASNICVDIKNLRKSFQPGPQIVLERLNLTVDCGESVAIMGISGSGKSTLLNVLSGLDHADKGQGEYRFNEFSVDGFYNSECRPKLTVTQLWRKMGFVFQTPFMLENFNVVFNIMLSAYCQGDAITRSQTKERIDLLLEKTSLRDHQKKLASQLSGGQRQRVAIARAVFHNPDLILADEPTGSLDPKTSGEIARLLKECALQTGENDKRSALIVVTHDPNLAIQFDRIEVLRSLKANHDNQNGLTRIPLPNGISSTQDFANAQNRDQRIEYFTQINEALGFDNEAHR